MASNLAPGETLQHTERTSYRRLLGTTGLSYDIRLTNTRLIVREAVTRFGSSALGGAESTTYRSLEDLNGIELGQTYSLFWLAATAVFALGGAISLMVFPIAAVFLLLFASGFLVLCLFSRMEVLTVYGEPKIEIPRRGLGNVAPLIDAIEKARLQRVNALWKLPDLALGETLQHTEKMAYRRGLFGTTGLSYDIQLTDKRLIVKESVTRFGTSALGGANVTMYRSLEDINGIQIGQVRSVRWLVAAAISAITIILIPVALIFLLLYLLSRQQVLTISGDPEIEIPQRGLGNVARLITAIEEARQQRVNVLNSLESTPPQSP